MAGILSGLGDLGLGGLEGLSLFDEPKEDKKDELAAGKEVIQIKEQDFLFDKAFTCTVCEADFMEKTVRVGKAKLLGSDLDLRPRYEHIELLKYDVIACPKCGYASLGRYFKAITPTQAKLIKETISSSYVPSKEIKEFYSFEDAIARYKLCLANSIVKRAKSSEKAYICLKTAWLIRSMKESMDKTETDYAVKAKEAKKQEEEFLKNALEGFTTARTSESYPMCGMDEPTVDYLIAVLSIQFGQYDAAGRLISGLLSSRGANPRMKDRARDLKDILLNKLKENGIS